MSSYAGGADHGVRPLSFYFARHGQTEYNRRGIRCGGDVDIPLCDEGRQEIEELARSVALERIIVSRLMVSPLERTMETAAPLREIFPSAEFVVDPDLVERRMGAWNGRSLDDTRNAIAVGLTPPGGESEVEFRTRVARVLERVALAPDRPTLLVSSSGVARVLHSLLGGAGRIAIPNARVFLFRAGYGADLDSAA